MPPTSFLGRFDFESSLAGSLADLPSIFCNACQHIVTETGGRKHDCKTRPTTIHGYPMCYLPHTVITSDLGSPDGNYQLEFNRVLTENSNLAVFSVGQEAPVSDTWQQDQQRVGCLSRLFSAGSSGCNATVSVGSYWPFKLSNQAIWYWHAEDGVLLVDWSKLYTDYFTQSRSSKNRRRIERIVHRYRDLEAEKMRNDTAGRWTSYGDWDIFPATHAEIAMACRYEGPKSDFEDRLDPRQDRMSPQEMVMRLGDRIVAVGEALRKRVDGKPKVYESEEKQECPKGPLSLWRRTSYSKLL
ncbi:hypothetical protein GGP41_008161 [Bipolaris sorokiniana]|uniref:Uncharacterized protein n=2 Tax=Cochliobolus sativus TaxID=45130 RepID=A0A8H5ZP22_COCSA|nr:uncharacterized protein COCSADRAFT_35256 [Bipolaris sorokiniana ND90Pr]EMD66767.1 hypothetical protein COCSADRAFT_35256 [Bipolaris sorokiniana ND90Pr]KAF5852747.1 hypothetical protein GGP41_008161 [Bipolaris sorokiniana]